MRLAANQLTLELLQGQLRLVVGGTFLSMVLLYVVGGISLRFWIGTLFAMLLLLIAGIDYETGMIFDRLLLPMGVLGVWMHSLLWGNGFTDSFAGAVLGGSLLTMLRILSHGGMGCGDIKFVFVLGLWLGLCDLLVALFFAFLSGGGAAFFLLLAKRKSIHDKIPFGPFLAFGAYISFLYADILLRFYGEWML
jgi:prepilin signal peptidase PulO-like enzyme (type II secretory pathway)